MYLTDVKVMNFPIDKILSKKNIYSNNYHVDYYTINFRDVYKFYLDDNWGQ